MNIGLDFDGVISDAGDLKTLGARRLFDVEIPPEQFKKELVIGQGILTAEQYRELQNVIYESIEVGMLMKPVTGALGYIEKLKSEGHHLQVVTSRTGQSLAVARQWAKAFGFNLEIVGVGYGISKAEAAEGADVYVDDDLDKLEELVGTVPNLFHFGWGYNAHIGAGNVATRVESWQELYGQIYQLAASSH